MHPNVNRSRERNSGGVRMFQQSLTNDLPAPIEVIKHSARRRPDHGVSLAVFRTTVLPVIKAAATGPPASANGKLYGAITTHIPYGFITLRLRERKPGSGSSGSGRWKPLRWT